MATYFLGFLLLPWFTSSSTAEKVGRGGGTLFTFYLSHWYVLMSSLLYTTFIRRKKDNISVWSSLTCKEIQENQALLGFLKARKKICKQKKPWFS
jgi:hypothetical protein